MTQIVQPKAGNGQGGMLAPSQKGKRLSLPIILDMGRIMVRLGRGSMSNGFRLAGYGDRSGYYKWLKMERSPRISTVAEILDHAGYQLVVVKK